MQPCATWCACTSCHCALSATHQLWVMRRRGQDASGWRFSRTKAKGFLSQKNCWKPCNTMVLAFNFESESVQHLKKCIPLSAFTLFNVPRILHCFVFLMPKFPAPDTFSCKWTYLNSWLYRWKTEWNWHVSGSHGFNRFLSLWWHLGIYSTNKPFTEQISHTSNFSHHKLPLLSGDTFVEQQPMLTLITRRDAM